MNLRERTRPPRRSSAASGRSAPRALAPTAMVLAVVGGCTGESGDPAQSISSSEPPVSPMVSPAPSPTASPTPSEQVRPAQAPALHVGGAVGDHPVRAPESQVVPYLTDLFGAAPRLEGDGVACETSGLPGRRLVWDGLTVLVRTTDESDAATEPYVAGWRVDEQNGTSPLGPLETAAGIGLGDTEQAVTAAYPQGQRFEVPEMGMSLWVLGSGTGDQTDDLDLRLVDGVVTAMGGGFGCGE